jgi:hypothetical protein
VEEPLRLRGNGQREGVRLFMGAAAATVVLISVPAGAAWRDGWIWRYPETVAAQLLTTTSEYNSYVGSRMNAAGQPFSNNGLPKLLVMGDSMGGDTLNMLAEGHLADRYDLSFILFNHLCQAVLFVESREAYKRYNPRSPDQCFEDVRRIESDPRLEQADVVMIASRWDNWSRPYLARTIDRLEGDGARVIVLGLKTLSTPGIQFLGDHGRDDRYAQIRMPIPRNTRVTNKALAQVVGEHSAEFLDPLTLFCSDGRCPMALPDGRLIYWDTLHLTKAGAVELGRALAQKGVL